MTRRDIVLLIALLLTLGLTVGCGTSAPSNDASVVSVSIDQTDPQGIEVGGSLQLTVDVVTTGGADDTVSWSSSDTGIATVDASTGLVAGVAEGSATITASSNADGAVSDSITVNVTPDSSPQPNPDGANFYAWSPEDGPKFLAPGDGYSINMVAEEHFAGARFHTYFVPEEVSGNGWTTIMFKWLTDEVLFVLTGEPERIGEFLATFDLEEFLSSWKLESELTYAMQNEGPVLDLEILNALGPPSSRTTVTTETGVTERWEYAQYRIVLYFSDGVMTTVVTY